MLGRTLHIFLVLLVAGLAVWPPSVSAQSADSERVAVIKAGMVVNFLKFTEWPADAFPQRDSPLTLTMVGHCLSDVMERAVAARHTASRKIVVRRLHFPAPPPGQRDVTPEQLDDFFIELRRSHAVFICDSERQRLHLLLDGLARADVLTISDIPDFAEHGGMLGLAVRGDRVVFDANPDEIRQTRVRVSSEVLRLARIVKTTRR